MLFSDRSDKLSSKSKNVLTMEKSFIQLIILKNHRCGRPYIFTLKSDLFRCLSANSRASPFREKHASQNLSSLQFEEDGF